MHAMSGEKPNLSPEQLAKPLRLRDIENLMAGIAPVLRDAINAAVMPLRDRIAELEARPALKYCGVWSEGVYQEGHFVSHGGSLWACKRATLGKPGQSDDWQLAVKRGADGRDGRR
jgi:hypothetical protein